MNIPHIIECFSPSSVTSMEDRFCLFRTWSFTLFKNDPDSTDNSNSVSSFPMINCCGLAPLWGITTGCPDLSHIEVSDFHRRPSLVIITLWVACWEGVFNKLFMIIVRRGFGVAAHNGLPRSIFSLSFRNPGILISIASLPRAFWSRGRYERRRPGNKIHHRSRFRCDSFFSWFLLSSFCHMGQYGGKDVIGIRRKRMSNFLCYKSIV